MSPFLDPEVLGRLGEATLRERLAASWMSLPVLIVPSGFDALLRDFPEIALFERHEGMLRPHGQKPHDRYYLAYESSPYHPGDPRAPGVIGKEGLSSSWRDFIEELESETYLSRVRTALGAPRLRVRFAWHVGVAGTSVSPHRDAVEKLGTQLFYFNTSADWREEWGGATLLLFGKRVRSESPDFDDFDDRVSPPFLDNHSLIFCNGRDAWHGVPRLVCPPGARRLIFNVIFEEPASRPFGHRAAAAVRQAVVRLAGGKRSPAGMGAR